MNVDSSEKLPSSKTSRNSVPLGLRPWRGVRHAAGEVPQIALLEIVDEVPAFVVDRSHADLAIQHVCPLGLLVPMQLADDPLVQAHIHTRQLDAGAQLADGRLSGPSTFLQLVVSTEERAKAVIELCRGALGSSPQCARANRRSSTACSQCFRDRCWAGAPDRGSA